MPSIGDVRRVKPKIDASRFDRGLGGLNCGGRGRDLRLGGFHLRFGRLKLRLGRDVVLRGIVEILLRDRLLLRERRVAIDVKLDSPLVGLRHRNLRFRLSQLGARLFQLALGLRQLSFRLFQRRLERPGVDLKQQLAALDESALGVFLLDQVTGDLSLDVGIDKSVERADPLAVDRNVFLIDLGHVHGERLRRLRRGRGPRTAGRGEQNSRDD